MDLEKMRNLTHGMKKIKEENSQSNDESIELSNKILQSAFNNISRKRPKKAFKGFLAAAKLGNTVAMYNIGLSYSNGIGVEKNLAESVKWFLKAAEAGELEAMYNVAMAYKDGVGVEKNWEKCFEWARKAAEAGNVLGMFVTSVCYDEGLGVNKDTARSFAWLKKAIETDEATLANTVGDKVGHMLSLMGWQYLYGEGVLQNSQEGVRWLTKAADRYNDYLSIRLLGLLYGKGGIPDIPQNIDTALKYFEKIAKLNFPNKEYAMEDAHNLWILCEEKIKGTNTLEENRKYKSMKEKWCKEAARLGDEEAKNELGRFQSRLKLTEREIETLTESVEEGNSNSRVKLGCYLLTIGDYDSAVKHLEAAQYEVWKYGAYKGHGVDSHREWIEKINQSGKDAALCTFSIMYKEGIGVLQDNEKAAEFEHQSNNGCFDSWTIGRVYEALNMEEKAIQYYENALTGLNHIEKIPKGYYVNPDPSNKYILEMYLTASMNNFLFDSKLLKILLRNWPTRKTQENEKVFVKDIWDRIDKQQNNGEKNLNKKRNKKGGCFITTAVCGSFGKSDDCYELTAFRNFRDGWLRQQSDGEFLIAQYYQIAPIIVEHINLLPDAKEIYHCIWEKYLKSCLDCLKEAQYQRCKQIYIKMVESLEKTYG